MLSDILQAPARWAGVGVWGVLREHLRVVGRPEEARPDSQQASSRAAGLGRVGGGGPGISLLPQH